MYFVRCEECDRVERYESIFVKKRGWNYEYDFEYDFSVNKPLKSILVHMFI